MKLLNSAVSNINYNNEDINLEQNDLYVKKIYVDGGPTLKRFRPAAMGRAVRILKRTSNLTIVLSDKR